jgi:uncharacterized membrane protein YeaQ/YmgE (transglycosylase-associated protein family)
MTLIGFIILLVVAFVVGLTGERIAGAKVPGDWLGATVAGLMGAWICGALLHFGPVLGGLQIFPAIIGAAIFVFPIRLLFSATQRPRTGTPA